MSNHLYYGDNLVVLRKSIKDETVDLIYLDPPFNSQATYNVLFKSQAGERSQAQIEAFQDTWHWNDQGPKAVRFLTLTTMNLVSRPYVIVYRLHNDVAEIWRNHP